MSYLFPESRLIVFCKAPVPGKVKTRLTPALSQTEAAALHRQLTLRLLRMLCESSLCPVELWCSPSVQHPFFITCARQFDITLHQQKGENLGGRMCHAFDDVLTRADSALLLGCDCPSINSDDLQRAFKALELENTIAIAPAEDGGYVMIGLTQTLPMLFSDIAWGTHTVFDDTVQRVKHLGFSLYQTTRQWDIDTIDDWQRFKQL